MSDRAEILMPGASNTRDESRDRMREDIPDDVYRRRWLILGVLCMSLMIVVIGNTSLNVALPRMSEALGLSNSQQQWVVDAYSLVFAGMLFTAGTLGDRFGRKGFMQAGIVL